MWRTAERRFARHVCLRHPLRPFLFGTPSIHSLPEAWGLREYSHSTLHQFCSYRKKHPFHAEKQSVWSRRFAGRVCLRHAFRPFLCGIPNIYSLSEAGSWERQYAPPVLHYHGCIMAIPSLQLQRKAPVSCREAKRLLTDLWSQRFVTYNTVILSKVWVTGYWLCSQLCYVTAADHWTAVEIELLATVGWKWGCQPFSCPCALNVMHCRKEICSTWLCKESIPATPFGISKHPLLVRSLRFPRVAAHSTSSALCLHHAHPFISATEKCQSHAQKQRVWSRSCGLHDFLQCSDCVQNLDCRFLIMLSVVLCDCCKPTSNCRDRAFSNSGLKGGGCQPFSCPDLQNMVHCRKEICSTCSFQECIPAIPLGNAKHPLLVRSLRFPRVAAHSTSSALCLHYACKRSYPFVADSGLVSHVEKHRLGHRVVASKVCYGILECDFSYLPCYCIESRLSF